MKLFGGLKLRNSLGQVRNHVERVFKLPLRPVRKVAIASNGHLNSWCLHHVEASAVRRKIFDCLSLITHGRTVSVNLTQPLPLFGAVA